MVPGICRAKELYILTNLPMPQIKASAELLSQCTDTQKNCSGIKHKMLYFLHLRVANKCFLSFRSHILLAFLLTAMQLLPVLRSRFSSAIVSSCTSSLHSYSKQPCSHLTDDLAERNESDLIL